MAGHKGPLLFAAVLMGACATWLLAKGPPMLRPPIRNIVGLSAAGWGPEPKPLDWWEAMHQKLVAEIQAADEAKEGFGIIFYGDSITESWRGTDGGGACPRCAGAPEVLDRHFGKYNPGIMAIGGDLSENLWWRLLHGETPQVNRPKAVVLLIGTNDLGKVWGDSGWDPRAEPLIMQAVPGVTSRVLSILHLLRQRLPDTHVVLLGLLPRGGSPDPAKVYTWPSIFTNPFFAVNDHFRQYADLDGHIHYLDCGDRFFTPDHHAIDKGLMPDALHPSAAGYELFAQCLLPLVTTIMQGHMPGSAGQAVAAAGNATVRHRAAAARA